MQTRQGRDYATRSSPLAKRNSTEAYSRKDITCLVCCIMQTRQGRDYATRSSPLAKRNSTEAYSRKDITCLVCCIMQTRQDRKRENYETRSFNRR
jgi:hypothetical protein